MIGVKQISRLFHFSRVLKDMVKTPVQVYGVEGNYASAVYSAAIKSNAIDNVEKDLRTLESVVNQSPKLGDFLANPTISMTEKHAAVKTLSDEMKMSNISKNLLDAMVEKQRLGKLKGVFNSFKILMNAHRGQVQCKVVTAKPLDAASKAEVEAALQLFLKKGEVMLLETMVDPTIMGGMQVTVGDKFVDMSVSTKMKKYMNAISSPV